MPDAAAISPVAAAGDGHTPERRLPGLDLLRAAAITLVMVQHAFQLLLGSPEPWRDWAHFGRFGVDLFFVLSGFLVGGIVLRTGEALARPCVLAGFLLGRWLRTLPLYYFILAVRLFLRAVIYGVPLPAWTVLGGYALFVQNFAWPMPAYFVESWSLAVEEWFYLLLPLLALAALRLGASAPRAIWLAAGLLLLGPLAARSIVSDPANALHHVVVFRLDSIAWGLLAAAIARARPEAWSRQTRAKGCLGLGLIVAVYVAVSRTDAATAAWLRAVEPTLEAIGFALLLPWAASAVSIGPRWWSRAVAAIARWSYSLYLTNLLIAVLFFQHVVAARPDAGIGTRLAWVAGFWLATLAISAALYRWIESPMLGLRWRIGACREAAAARAERRSEA